VEKADFGRDRKERVKRAELRGLLKPRDLASMSQKSKMTQTVEGCKGTSIEVGSKNVSIPATIMWESKFIYFTEILIYLWVMKDTFM
jgi:hypothetical protein